MKLQGDQRALCGRREIAKGILRPQLVLYDEIHLGTDSIHKAVMMDLKRRPQILIVMGTSLQITSLKQMIKTLTQYAQLVIFVNKTRPPADLIPFFHIWIQGECDVFSQALMKTWQERRPQDWEVQSTLPVTILPREYVKTFKANEYRYKIEKGPFNDLKPKQGKPFRINTVYLTVSSGLVCSDQMQFMIVQNRSLPTLTYLKGD